MEPKDVIREAADIMESAHVDLQVVLRDAGVRLTPMHIDAVRTLLSSCVSRSLVLGEKAGRERIPYRPQAEEIEQDLALRDTRPFGRKRP